MAFDAAGRSQQASCEDYFDADDTNQHNPAYASASPDPVRTDAAPPPRRTSPLRSPHFQSRRTTATTATNGERGSMANNDVVSPDLVAAITEKVKKERTCLCLCRLPLPSYSLVRAADQVVAVLEHLKLTGSIDDQLPRAPSETTDATPSPPPSQRGVYTPPSPKPPPNLTFPTFPTMPPARSPPASPVYEKPSAPGVRFSDRGVEREREREQTRQVRPGAARTYSTLELSTIDQRWGRLFDKEGNPTQRLGQVLRGLANHIVSVYSYCIG